MEKGSMYLSCEKCDNIIIRYRAINIMTMEAYWTDKVSICEYINRLGVVSNDSIVEESYTILSKFYGYIVITNTLGDKVWVLTEKELCMKFKGVNGKAFTNFRIVLRYDFRNYTVQPLNSSFTDISVLMTANMMNIDMKYIETALNLREKALKCNIEEFKRLCTLSETARKNILYSIFKLQGVKGSILDTLNIGDTIEEYMNSLE